MLGVPLHVHKSSRWGSPPSTYCEHLWTPVTLLSTSIVWPSVWPQVVTGTQSYDNLCEHLCDLNCVSILLCDHLCWTQVVTGDTRLLDHMPVLWTPVWTPMWPPLYVPIECPSYEHLCDLHCMSLLNARPHPIVWPTVWASQAVAYPDPYAGGGGLIRIFVNVLLLKLKIYTLEIKAKIIL